MASKDLPADVTALGTSTERAGSTVSGPALGTVPLPSINLFQPTPFSIPEFRMPPERARAAGGTGRSLARTTPAIPDGAARSEADAPLSLRPAPTQDAKQSITPAPRVPFTFNPSSNISLGVDVFARSIPTPAPSTVYGLTSSTLGSSRSGDEFLHAFLTKLDMADRWFSVLACIGMTERNFRLLAGFDEARRDALIAKVLPEMKVMDRAILADAIRRLT
ncbi:hypothetical protein FB451DRAFT_1182924 [Mycena latifolia]|nr:hypothetical protein FB451DRAFT_1182924 [Mycena latifolia]